VNEDNYQDISDPQQVSESGQNVAWAAGPDARPAPRRVAVRNTSPAYVTFAILVLTILIYLAQLGTEYLVDIDLPAAYGIKANELIIAGQLWRLITPVLLHGSILHIGFNMYALYLLGPGLEKNFGHWRFLTLYLLSGFAGNVMSMILTDAPSLGSSTAIFGLLAAHGIFVYQNRKLIGEQVAQQAINRIARVALINLVIGLSPGIDNWGHVGGLIGGALFAWFGGPLLQIGGIHPVITINDKRDASQILQAIAITGGSFALTAAIALYFMSQ
jgi:rhomboid protease GluP